MQLRPLTIMTESQWTFVRNEHNKITSLPNGFVFRGDLLLFHIFGIIDLLYYSIDECLFRLSAPMVYSSSP